MWGDHALLNLGLGILVAMIFSAAARYGEFFKPTPTGRGFARVENLRASSTNSLDKLRGQRGDAGKPLEKIQSNALGAQNGVRRAGNFQQGFSGGKFLSVARRFFYSNFRREFAEGGFSEFNSCDDKRFARAQAREGYCVLRNGGERGHVAAAEVFGERGADGAANFSDGQFHTAKMTANHGAGKQKPENWRAGKVF